MGKDTLLMFDLDGTLWDSAQAVAESWNEVFRKWDPSLPDLTAEDVSRVTRYLINPVESREAALGAKPASLAMETTVPPDVKTMAGFTTLDAAGIAAMVKELGLAMSVEDLAFCQTYFRDTEKRDPTFTEIKVIDTYWSDHCRHTTFATSLDKGRTFLSHPRRCHIHRRCALREPALRRVRGQGRRARYT